jgi:high frequency lysogenization protein
VGLLEQLFGSPETEADRTVALGGVYQAAALVQNIAQSGEAPIDSLSTTISSVLSLDAANVLDVYGGVGNLRVGFQVLQQQLGRSMGPRDMEITRYVSGLVMLERSLVKSPWRLETIRGAVTHANNRAAVSGPLDDEVIQLLADAYKDTVSTMAPRIMVNGKPHHLNTPHNASLIRALLLAAIRSAVLWRQLGGSRRRLLLTRNHVLLIAKQATN